MRRATFTSDQLLRAILVMEREGLTYRETAMHIDDSQFLWPVRAHPWRPVMDFTVLCRTYKASSTAAWRRMNQLLARYAIGGDLITGTHLRDDTTVSETNIHFPTDATLLWDA